MAEEYGDFIYQYYLIPEETRRELEGTGLFSDVGRQYTILRLGIPEERPLRLAEDFGYFVIPKVYGLLDAGSMEAAGITSVQNQPVLMQKGQGVLIGFVDTGIDYMLDIFRNPDGTSRISALWDQTADKDLELGRASLDGYGRVYFREEINQALETQDPLALVPETDENGHGTFLASIAAGGTIDGSFTGAAPEADIAVVKLRQAGAYLREYFLIPEEAEAFSESDIMLGVQFLAREASRVGKPLVILLGLGSNQGNHMGSEPLASYLQLIGFQSGVAVVTAAGNETGRGHHFYGNISSGQAYEDVEIQVAEEEPGFSLELWSRAPETYSVSILSPVYGETAGLQVSGSGSDVYQFVLDGTTVFVNYRQVESWSGGQLILMRFLKPSKGIWRIRVSNDLYLNGQYHLWLPLTGFIREDTRFLRPNPDMTIVSPGNGKNILTAGAYQHQNGSIWNYSSRGYSGTGAVKPDLAAPGFEVAGMVPGGRTEVRSGTSIAAAHGAGAAAILISWGLVEGNLEVMNTTTVTNYLIRGADRKSTLQYPNREWGYGSLNLYQTFLKIR